MKTVKERIEEFVNDKLYYPGHKNLTCDTIAYNPNSYFLNYIILGCKDYSFLTYGCNWIDVKVTTFGEYELTQEDKDRIKDIQDNLQQLWRLVRNGYDMELDRILGVGLEDIIVNQKVDSFNE